MDTFLSHLLATAVPLIGAVWYLGTAIGKIQQALKPLESLPERVAKVEAKLETVKVK